MYFEIASPVWDHTSTSHQWSTGSKGTEQGLSQAVATTLIFSHPPTQKKSRTSVYTLSSCCFSLNEKWELGHSSGVCMYMY